MATNFPTGLDALTNPTSTDTLNSPSHAGQHTDANDAIEALQSKVGVNGSAVTTSLDYKVGQLETNSVSKTVVDAKGDLIAGTANDTVARVPASTTNGQVLTVDTAQATGLTWATPSTDAPVGAQYVTLAADSTLTNEQVLTAGTGITVTPGSPGGNVTVATSAILPTVIDAKGDLLVGTGNDAVDNLAVGGTNNHVLVVDSGNATFGIKWADSFAIPQTVETKTGAYSIVAGDAGKLIRMNATADFTVNSSTGFSTGQRVDIVRIAAGAANVVQGSGATVNGTPGLKLRAQYSAASIVCVASNTYYVIGDLSA